jgi:hypothetical protein
MGACDVRTVVDVRAVVGMRILMFPQVPSGLEGLATVRVSACVWAVLGMRLEMHA